MKKSLKLLSLFVALFLVVSQSALAQTLTSGSVTGVIKDSQGAVVPNAKVTVTNEATNVASTTTTNGSGEYQMTNLLPGMYDVRTEVSGFQPMVVKGVKVELSSTTPVPMQLTVGSASATVEVNAGAGTMIDTTTANLSTTLSTSELEVLPTASIGLGVVNTSLLVPGVASSGGIGVGTGPSIGGQRPRDNNFTIEGIDNNNKGVTGPLVYVPNDAVADFTLITNQFSPEFGHSNGGQFNTNVLSGTNSVHGALYEYFNNRNLNAESGTAGGKPAINPRYDFNRYGGQAGAPILKNKVFAFGNFERQTLGQSLTYYVCTPTAAGLTTLSGLAGTYGLNATNLAQYLKYTPVANYLGGAQLTGAQDNACGESATGLQSTTVYKDIIKGGNGEFGSGAVNTAIPLGNFLVSAPTFSNFDALTTSGDYTMSTKDSLRLRYLYNTQGTQDTAAVLPIFFQSLPYKFHLIAISEFHNFTPNLTNEFRIGYNRYSNTTPSGPFSYPGLDSFPNLIFDELGFINYGPDGNAPQSTIQNLYQVTDNVSWVKGTHTISLGFDGRKFISPQTFTQRVRGDYDYDFLTEFLHDLAPTDFGQRSTGNFIYYGDQTAFYGYGNDTWRVTPTLTLNYGLRYEFTSVPVGMRAQSLNAAASVPGVLVFGAPKPQYKNFAPRFGINYSPDAKTSIRAGFGLGYDVIFDNIGLLSFPPQYSSTNSTGDANTNYLGKVNPNPGDPNFLSSGGLPPGNGGLAVFCNTGTGGSTGVPCVLSVAKQKAATSAYVPDQKVPYAESWNLQIQRTFGSNYVFSVGYVGTRGIHLETQVQINKQQKVTVANQLPTYYGTAAAQIPSNFIISTSANVNTLGANAVAANTTTGQLAIAANGIVGLNSAVVPLFANAGFTGTITSYQPYSQSSYNGLDVNLTRRMQNGLQMNLSYTWSKTMDDATSEVNSTGLTPRRQQNHQCIACDYSRSALDRTHRITMEAIYDVPFFKHSGFLMRNLAGNWEIAPIYTYESPEYATVLSGINANLNGDTASAIDRTIANNGGDRNASSLVHAVFSNNPALVALCPIGTTTCGANTVGYVATTNPNAYYIQAGQGTLPNVARNTLPIRPIDNIDVTALKRISFKDRYSFEFGATALNVLNHAQYIPGSVDTVNPKNTANVFSFNSVTNANFNNPGKVYSNNARVLQLGAKIRF
jgi:Carboxypeptidase regulatory-like domain/TonB dependent receptor